MKFAVICPIPLLQKYATTSTYHMALTHLVLESPEYAEFYKERKKRGDFVILDNSLIELGEAADMEKVLRAADMIKPDEIVLPDVFRKKDETIYAIELALYNYGKEMSKYKLMAVAQGETTEEWIDCYRALGEYPEIHTIGIPKVLTDITGCNAGRYEICDYLSRHGLVHLDKDHHLLGVWANPWPEIPKCSQFYWLRGVDTILPVLMGMLGVKFSWRGGLQVPRPKMAVDFRRCVDEFPEAIRHNIQIMMAWGNMY